MVIREITADKERHWDLLLLADPDIGMVRRYLDSGRMFLLEDHGGAVAEAVVTDLGKGACEEKTWRFERIANGEDMEPG